MVYKVLAFLMIGSALAYTAALGAGKEPHIINAQVTKGREAMKLTHRGRHQEKVSPGGVQWLVADGKESNHGFRLLEPDEKIIEHTGDQAKEYSGENQEEVARKQK
jgi:hypothetical protein